MVYVIGSLFLMPVLWIFIVCYMGYQVRRQLLPTHKAHLYVRIFFMFAISALISGLLSFNWKVMIGSLTIPAFYIITVYLIDYCDSREKIYDILKYAFYFAVLSALIGLIWELFDINKEVAPFKMLFGLCDIFENPKNASRLLATFYNANVAATFFGCMFFVGLHLITHLKGQQVAYLAVGEAIIAIAFLLTESRAGLLGVFIGLVCYFFCQRNRAFTIFAATIGVIWLIVLLAAPEIMARGGEILMTDMDTRWQIWFDGLKQFAAKPLFGWGFLGAFFYEGEAYRFMHVAHPHNLVLAALSFYGFIGFLLCCALEITKIRVIAGLVKSGDQLAPLFLAISSVFWGQGIFDCTIANPQAGIFYFASSAILIALSKVFSSSQKEINEPPDFA